MDTRYLDDLTPGERYETGGIAPLRYQSENQRGEPVLGFVVNHLLRRRPG